ncbi:MAG: lipopolysaccharide biosynthesis protein [Alistipes sp.]|jgi:O-antigen/teichoic acid export membrane protein|nr:lipopolysaccharide biosynthesis protein [Alistipes sp.]
MAELKKKVVRGFTWSAAEKVASALFQAWIFVNVANRLFPEDYAMVAILTAFGAVFNTFVDSGFSQALIRNKDASPTDFSSAFGFNMAMSVAIYAVLVGLSYPTAAVLDMPRLPELAPVLYLVVPLNALGIIQQTVLVREFGFRRMSTIVFAATVCSGLVSLGLAVAGFGVWALVGMRVSMMGFRALLFWTFGRWRPSGGFSMGSIRGMFSYSARLLGTDLLNNVYNNVPQIIIGRIHHGTLGHYDQARKLRDHPLTAAMSAMQSVTFPALAAVADDDDKFARSVGRVAGSIAFLMFPIMAGLAAVAGEIFGVFLGPQWQGSVPFLRILCIAGFATPIAVVSSNILRTRTGGGAVIRAEVIKKVIATVVLGATIPFGAMAIAWGVSAIAVSDAVVSFAVASKHSAYGFRDLARDVLPVLGLSLAMAAAVWGVGLVLSGFAAPWMVLAAKILAGVAVYLGGAALLRLDAFGEFMEVVRKIVGKIKA